MTTLSRLLGIETDRLEAGLCTRSIRAGRDAVTVLLEPSQAAGAKDVVAKALYAQLFEWTVDRINDSMGYEDTAAPPNPDNHFIGIVDIFGFEIFPVNSLEQLCINYANEKLQQLFTKYVFEMEQEEYAAEAIPWTFVDYPNNDLVVLLFEARRGLFRLLDEQCMLPKGTDAQFAKSLYDCVGKHPRFSASKLQVGASQFSVLHYAGTVAYVTDGFCDKNKDHVHDEAIEMLSRSSNSFVADLFQSFQVLNMLPPARPVDDGKPRRSSGIMGATVAMKFKTQLGYLLDVLQATAPHFVRCIKPNDSLCPGLLDEPRVLEQLRCSGILEAATVSRLGYPVRFLHADFMLRFKVLAPAERSVAAMAATLAAKFHLVGDRPPFQVGVSKVFVVQSAFDVLQREATVALRRSVVRLQALARMRAARVAFLAVRRATVVVQAAIRQWLFRRWCHRRRAAAVVVQSSYRRHRARIALERLRDEASRVAAAQAAEAALQRAQAAALAKEREIAAQRVAAEAAAAAADAHRLAALQSPARAPFYPTSIDDTDDDSDDESLAGSLANKYDVTWPSGMLGVFFARDELSGFPVVQRVYPDWSGCATIDLVAVEDVLVAIGAKKLVPHASLHQTLAYMNDIPKPVRLVFQRRGQHPAVSLLPNEYEVRWASHEPLNLHFKLHRQLRMPYVSRILSLPQPNEPPLVQKGDLLTHVQHEATVRKSQDEINHMLSDQKKPCVLRFRTPDDADRLSVASTASTASSSRRSSIALPKVAPDATYSITWTDDDGPLGLVVTPLLNYYIEVVRVKDEGAAFAVRQRGRVCAGDTLLAINQQDISSMGFQHAMHVLKTSPKPLVLTLERTARSTVPPLRPSLPGMA
ncbi:myosin-like protein [Achlya hypogyna]|uniref:Myosin-like protein n=1 Tax=Achlya hypogyna TaxID=1202772 RepID=A0A1V9ZAK4_ACHHY|nr:myosin-like protein [Achlya hypogyna]